MDFVFLQIKKRISTDLSKTWKETKVYICDMVHGYWHFLLEIFMSATFSDNLL
jgi:hypothetical protein